MSDRHEHLLKNTREGLSLVHWKKKLFRLSISKKEKCLFSLGFI